MNRGGRPTRFETDKAIELYLARQRGTKATELATENGCDPDTITRAAREGKNALGELVQAKGLAWVAGRFNMATADLMTHL